jgi:hypothetical protein
MDIITLDFETYFSDDYTLSNMTTEAYIRDPRFEVHGCAFRWPEGWAEWISGDDLPDLFSSSDYSDGAVLCHHTAFDGLILTHHYGVKPGRWLDTYSMAQYLFGPGQSKSLGGLAERFGLAPKTMPYDLVRGRHWASLSILDRQAVAAGCLRDVELTWTIFNRMMTGDYR